ncbi:hypothetical protein ZIOFF_023848 [Zingiber officinale]|uniref:RRM domain-containing protein n=1 Tax=Zingiber officinale TaxID=94328 RepID=A0A8J5GRB6_ZINOF|nr:hypothetical protein ZIOFF_023848 [Zingiber officinale]
MSNWPYEAFRQSVVVRTPLRLPSGAISMLSAPSAAAFQSQIVCGRLALLSLLVIIFFLMRDSFGDDLVVLNLVKVSLGLLMKSLSGMPSLPSARSRKVCLHSLFSNLAFNPSAALRKDIRIMYDKSTGRSRGFGFVRFATDDAAKYARNAMDGKAFLGRPLRISFAVDKVRGVPIVVPRLPADEESTN